MSNDHVTFVDVTPNPRILRALGEIPFEPWQCFAELIDNSMDAFETAARLGLSLSRKQVILSWSTEAVASKDRKIELRDTGPGMSLDTIQDCVRAGYTSNDPTNSLGLFGMGFNIATARLGDETMFLSSRSGDREWVGVCIDFDAIGKSNKFHVPVVRIEKTNIDEHGTRVIVSKLKPGIYENLRRNASQIKVILEDVYSSILASKPDLSILVNGRACKPVLDCVWDSQRFVLYSGQQVPAIIQINEVIGTSLFNVTKNRYLSVDEEFDAITYKEENESFPSGIIEREKRIQGWVGIQRFADTSLFGINFIRNGRKILRKDKSLFKFQIEITGTEVIEYPIELGSTQGGRIVGEIHVDHLVPTYQKNDFDRTDKSWYEMVNLLRGDGPLLPRKRAELGYDGANTAPLGLLVNAFRRMDPGTRNLAIPNSLAKEWRRKFESGDPEHRSDVLWWSAAQQADQDRAEGGTSRSRPTNPGTEPSDDPGDYLPPTVTIPPSQNPTEPTSLLPQDEQTGVSTVSTPVEVETPRPPVDELSELVSRSTMDLKLTREYGYRNCPSPLRVEVRRITSGVISEHNGIPAKWDSRNFNQLKFFYDPQHTFFRTSRFSPHEIMIIYLAELFKNRDRLTDDMPLIYVNIIETMFPDEKVDQLTIQERAKEFFGELRDSALRLLDAREAEVLDVVHEHAGELEDTILGLMANPGVQSRLQARTPGGIMALSAVPERTLVRLVATFPEVFFDGKFFKSNYQNINLSSREATERIREEAKERIINYMKDALWVISPRSNGTKEQLLRCAHSIDLLVEEVVG